MITLVTVTKVLIELCNNKVTESSHIFRVCSIHSKEDTTITVFPNTDMDEEVDVCVIVNLKGEPVINRDIVIVITNGDCLPSLISDRFCNLIQVVTDIH